MVLEVLPEAQAQPFTGSRVSWMWLVTSWCTGSEDLWVLANLTNPIVLESLGSHEQSFNGFTSNSNSSLAQLHSFARPALVHLSNFTDIFNDAVENDYTSAMWDQDTTLVIYIFNLSSPMTFKITVDQQDLLFLLYFFITFITYDMYSYSTLCCRCKDRVLFLGFTSRLGKYFKGVEVPWHLHQWECDAKILCQNNLKYRLFWMRGMHHNLIGCVAMLKEWAGSQKDISSLLSDKPSQFICPPADVFRFSWLCFFLAGISSKKLQSETCFGWVMCFSIHSSLSSLSQLVILQQQYIELQRRVARPFARMKLQIEKLYSDPDDEYHPQNASYIGVETCKDNKAAILSLFIRLPGNQTTGRPVVGRSGLCVGSTMVKVNPSRKSKESNKVKKRKSNGSSNAIETNSHSRVQNSNHSTSIPVWIFIFLLGPSPKLFFVWIVMFIVTQLYEQHTLIMLLLYYIYYINVFFYVSFTPGRQGTSPTPPASSYTFLLTATASISAASC